MRGDGKFPIGLLDLQLCRIGRDAQSVVIRSVHRFRHIEGFTDGSPSIMLIV